VKSHYSLTVRSTAWFTSARALFFAASQRLPVNFFSNRSDWRCDLSSLVRFFAMLTVSHKESVDLLDVQGENIP
jgi:hypothetical protein